jgi:hypothetical protein
MPASRVVLIVVGVALVVVWMTAAMGACAADRGGARPRAETPVAVSAPAPAGQPVLLDARRPAAVAAGRRNPFKLAWRAPRRAAEAASRGAEPPPPPPLSAMPDGPVLTLVGVTDSSAGGRQVRTAIVSGVGELWLTAEGGTIAGRFRVERIHDDRVDLHDSVTGSTRVLRLR